MYSLINIISLIISALALSILILTNLVIFLITRETLVILDNIEKIKGEIDKFTDPSTFTSALCSRALALLLNFLTLVPVTYTFDYNSLSTFMSTCGYLHEH